MDSDDPGVYPSPTLVAGVGRLGLAVLEQLGDDWRTLQDSGGDASLGNLRLLHIAPRDPAEAPWRAREQGITRLAHHVGDSDLPSLAVNLVILRALGLVRYRDGCYQVALPRDAGVVETLETSTDETGAAVEIGAADKAGTGERGLVRRRRYFDWLSLSPDPVTAVERLCRHADRSSELDLFITPIVNRVRQGHSPRALLACIARCHALSCGRDPSPWGWVKTLVGRFEGTGEVDLRLAPDHPDAESLLALAPDDHESSPQESALGLLDSWAPSPLAGWRGWLQARYVAPLAEQAEPSAGDAGATAGELRLRIPQVFRPQSEDGELWLDPLQLLRVDWEASGWATGGAEGDDAIEFEPVQASPFRLGLFDHDDTAVTGGLDLAPRLTELADLARRGLVRLWVDLQRDRVEEGSALVLVGDRHRETADEALRQSLEILGELLVRPLAKESPEGVGIDGTEVPEPEAELEERSTHPSPTLGSLRLPPTHAGSDVGVLLEQRLADLGLGSGDEDDRGTPIFAQVALGPRDIEAPSGTAAGLAEPSEGRDLEGGLVELGRALNRQVRGLLDIRHLERWRRRPIRRPPRVTLYLVGDMGEPFVRASLRTVLREIHAELLRAFSPIFEHYREGFDRSLSIVPILWMPHPADPFEGRRGTSSGRREEESAVIDAVQGVRRWVESVIPASRRRVSQIFVNSRVTDTAVLDTDDAVRQTRDFVTLQVRNETGADEWLRRTATGPTGDDFFSSFACYEVAFPAEKAREALANRLVRQLLDQLEWGPGNQGLVEALEDRPSLGALAVEPRQLAAPATNDLLRGAAAELARQTTELAERLVEQVEGTAWIDAAQSAERLAAAFDPALGARLEGEVRRGWSRLVEHQGEVDVRLEGVRQRVGRLLGGTLDRVRRQGDVWVQQLAGELGLGAARGGFAERRRVALDLLRQADDRLRDDEALCLRHRLPDTSGIDTARQDVVEAAQAKPDLEPMRLGLVAWLFLAPILGAPLGARLATWLGPGVGSWLGGLVVALLGAVCLAVTMDRSLKRIEAAVESLARACFRIVAGSDAGDGVSDDAGDDLRDDLRDDVAQEPEATLPAESSGGIGEDDAKPFEVFGPRLAGAPSIRSFFETRLRLTGSLATRGFALGVFAQTAADTTLANRLRRSVDAQRASLARRAEDLGVRPSPDSTEGERLDGLFARAGVGSPGDPPEGLVSARSLGRHFEQRLGHGAEQGVLARSLLATVGGFEGWRETAPLADGEALLAFGRQHFANLSGPELARHHPFTDEAGRRLLDFVVRHFANIGFGARFLGSEGLDPDGVDLLAEAALVAHPDLLRLFEQARDEPGAPTTTRTLQRISCGVRPAAAYVVSLAQGIRPHTVRNLRRFESFYDRTSLPEDRTFPLSGDDGEQGSLNHLSAYGSLAETIHRASLHRASRGRQPRQPSSTGSTQIHPDPESGGPDAT